MSDAKALRRYQAGVERALGLFDASNEWADYIAFLSRLLKALQAAPSKAGVPSKATLAKYLAQCLRPSLPAGVHQKALEVYNVIFTLLGKDGLSQDLTLYLPGISHTLSFASLSVRPWFLALYDDHVLKLSSSTLRPALKAIILSLLPGIEEEQSDDFERTLATLNRLRATFAQSQSEDIFWQSLFLASITSHNRRMGVLVYLTRYLPKLVQSTGWSNKPDGSPVTNGTHVSVAAVTSPEPGLLIRCFTTGLQDDQPLVQRGFLDLLVTNLPLEAETLQKNSSDDDLDILVSAAMSIVLKRDMSLNRRLWAWFLGSDDKGGAPDDVQSPTVERHNGIDVTKGDRASNKASSSAYFSSFGLASIIRTFSKMLGRKSPIPSQRARAFRLLISLMDRSAIGIPVVDATFEPMIQDLQTYQTSAPSQEAFDEVFRSASVFFDSVEPWTIAHQLLKLFDKNKLELMEYVSTNLSLDEDEMVRQHLPAVVFVLSTRLLNANEGAAGPPAAGGLQYQERVARLMNLMLPINPFTSAGPSQPSRGTEFAAVLSVAAIYRSYDPVTRASDPISSMPAGILLEGILNNVSQAIVESLREPSTFLKLDYLTLIYSRLRASFPHDETNDSLKLSRELSQWVKERQGNALVPFSVLRNVATLAAATITQSQGSSSVHDNLKVIPALTEHFWHRLTPSTPQHHVESVEAIWALRSLTPTLYLVDSTILSLLGQSAATAVDQKHPISNFAILWSHTRLPSIPPLAASDGAAAQSEASRTAFLKMTLLYILDCANIDDVTDPCRLWLISLPSLSVHFQATLENIRTSRGSLQEVPTNLNRLLRLIKVAKSSTLSWKEFVEPSGLLMPVLDLATSILISSLDKDDWVQASLTMIRLIHDGADRIFDDSLVDTLSQQIPKTSNGSTLQSNILEIIQLLVTMPGAGTPPPSLLTILMAGISSSDVDTNIDIWTTLLCNAIPMYADSVFFANLLRLTDCFCKRVQSYFVALQSKFEDEAAADPRPHDSRLNLDNPERSITNLLSGLEYILARAHTKVTEAARSAPSTQDNTNEASRSRSQANNRLTAVLCMQDAIKVCGQVWNWRPPKRLTPLTSDSKSFSYLSSRLRARIRRMLEHLIDAEPQECLETLMGMWVDAVKKGINEDLVMSLLESLDGARPKFMMPAIFNAIYGRTNPGALDVDQRSSLSVNVTALELVAFLTDYVNTLEDDLLEEIWSDCTSFLRDMLANPMPHRQILLRLLEFLSTLCQKMENTNFGDQNRMRKELADLSARLFTAIFAIKPGGFDQSSGRLSSSPKQLGAISSSTERFKSGDGVDILRHVLPTMSPLLSEADRITSVYSGISANITGPLLRSRNFPANVGDAVLDLLLFMSKAQNATKTWRKDILDAFNDPKIFQCDAAVAESGWVPIVKQLIVLDKTIFVEVLSRLTPPATAGIMFGVGAAAARAEADKQAKINLRRIALVLMANEKDTFTSTFPQIMTRVEELFTASPVSSPSSTTRGEIFLLLRAVTLSFSQNNLASLWPIVDAELQATFEDLAKSIDSTFSTYSHMQAAKLLDVLLLIKPEEFQLHEWLYITDTVDAVYPPVSSRSTALADNLLLETADSTGLESMTTEGGRKPWLCADLSRRGAELQAVLGSFFGHLSIRAFEDIYSLEPVDFRACRRDCFDDLYTNGD